MSVPRLLLCTLRPVDALGGFKAPIPLALSEDWIVGWRGTGAVWWLPGASCCCPGVRGGDGPGLDWSEGGNDGEM